MLTKLEFIDLSNSCLSSGQIRYCEYATNSDSHENFELLNRPHSLAVQYVERRLLPKAKICLTTHVQLLQLLTGKQQQPCYCWYLGTKSKF